MILINNRMNKLSYSCTTLQQVFRQTNVTNKIRSSPFIREEQLKKSDIDFFFFKLQTRLLEILSFGFYSSANYNILLSVNGSVGCIFKKLKAKEST